MIVAGAVNGVPAKLNAKEGSGIVLPFADNGVEGTQEFQKNGDIFLPPGSGPDRVAIIGGSTVGRDHFPFAVTDYPATDYYPLGLSIADAAKWFYRVKKWLVTLHAELDVETDVFEYDGSDLVTNTYTGHATWDITAEVPVYCLDIISGIVPAIREAQLSLFVFAQSGELDTTGTIVWEDDYSTPVAAEAFVDLMDGGLGGEITFGAGTLYPLIYVGFYLSTECRPKNLGPFSGAYSGGDEQINLNVGSRAFLPSGDSLSTSILIDGNSIPSFYELAHDPESDATPRIELSNPSATITITPLEYWPYATKAGLPVYDTSTGAQLRDPLS